MRWRRIIARLSCVVLAGCDPRVSLAVRQRLLPAPSTDCLGAALAGSPEVVHATQLKREGGEDVFWVTLRDSTAKGGERTVTVTRLAPPDSGGKVEFHFVWGGLRRPPKAQEQAAIGLGNRLLGHLRNACAPQTPTPVECDYDGHVWPCAQAV
jgi:hypothetical protein